MPDALLEKNMRGLWLIVTGTGRCGTGYISQVLSSVGVRCTHEGVFKPTHVPNGAEVPPGLVTDEEVLYRVRLNRDNVEWGWEAESSWLAAPYLEWPEIKDMTIVHLVRHPKKVIDSQMRMMSFDYERGGLFYQFQYNHVPELICIEDEFTRAGYFYVEWNRLIEPHADIFWRVEDDVRVLLDKLGIEWRGKQLFDCKRYNSRSGWRTSDVDIRSLPQPLRGSIIEMAERYGYEI